MTKGVCTGKDGAVSGSQGDRTRPVEKCRSVSGRVRPEGNKEIMAPRCVCSRTEGRGGCGCLGEKRSKCAAVAVTVCVLTRQKTAL